MLEKVTFGAFLGDARIELGNEKSVPELVSVYVKEEKVGFQDVSRPRLVPGTQRKYAFYARNWLGKPLIFCASFEEIPTKAEDFLRGREVNIEKSYLLFGVVMLNVETPVC